MISEADIKIFHKRHNELTTNQNLLADLQAIRLFVNKNQNVLRGNLDIGKHRNLFIDWFLDSYPKIRASELKNRKDYDYYLYPAEIIEKDRSFLESDCDYVEIINYSGKGNERRRVRFTERFGWNPLCLADGGKLIFYKRKRMRRYIFSSMVMSEFLSLDLPDRGKWPLSNYIDTIKKEVLFFIRRYGYPFEGSGDIWLKDGDSFFYYFVHKWLRARDLMRLKNNYPKFPVIEKQMIDLDYVKFDLKYYQELVDEANKSVIQIPGRIIKNSRYLEDNYSTLYGLILNTILFEKWKQCEYKYCEELFIPQGNNKRACCSLHAKRLRAHNFRHKNIASK